MLFLTKRGGVVLGKIGCFACWQVRRIAVDTLTVRSENFATKADVSDIRTEMAELRGEIKTEIAKLRGELKAAMVESQQSILKAIDEKSRWKWGSVFIPLAVGVAGVLATLLAAHLSG
ncbi:hypothetical protein VU574_04585 [Enterobacter kobei]|uniref:hypothetical protein n=1 Tax=Enterobacter kobei TaxID=208224 RepID=UPI002A801BBA|nr:hypothetical protein [Enterobacter kobei]